MKQSYDLGKLRTDPRFIALSEQIGGEHAALWHLSLFWDCALNYWKKRELVPKKVFALNKAWHLLVEVGLAEEEDGGVYAKGAKDAFDWVLDLQASKHEAGVASAKARREKFGTAQPQPASKPKPEQRSEVFDRTDDRTGPEQPEQARTDPNASISISVSSSVSAKKKRTLSPKTVDPEDEALAQEWYAMACRYSTTVTYGPKWPDTVRMLREIDKLTPDTIRELLAFIESDDFWRPNALSVVQLRVRSKTNGLLKWENALAKMRSELDAHGLGGGADSWAGFEEACAALENQKRDH